MSNTAQPRVSALVSTYASAEFIGECLEDLTTQTIADELEIVVVDADSPEDEQSVVREYQQRFPRIVYHRTPKRIGIYPAWNIAAKMASGRYLMSASTNDRLAPDCCEMLAERLDSDESVGLVYGNSHLTETPHESFAEYTPSSNMGGDFLWPPFCYEELLIRCMVGPHAMWRADVHAKVGYFDESYKALGDQDMWLRIGREYNVRHLDRFTGLYWQSPDALSVQPHTQDELKRIRRKYLAGYLMDPGMEPYREVADAVMAEIKADRIPNAIALFAQTLMPEILMERFNEFSAKLAALLEAGKTPQALALYHKERDNHARLLAETAQLDEIMTRLENRAA